MAPILPLAAALAVLVPLQQGRRGIPTIPADKEPVVKTASGLKYCVLTQGPDGPSPRLGDMVKVHYTGWQTDGAVFDSSRQDAKPTEFTLGDVIDGWNEALQMMTPGAHWKIVVPPELGYGARGSPPRVKPNATLIFELELVSFEKGIDLPPFHAGDPAKQKKTESGLVYEPIKESDAAPPRPEELLEIKYAVWNTKGRLIECSEKKNTLRGRASDLPLRLLQIAPQYIPVGARYRFEAPYDLCKNLQGFGAPFLPAGSTTVWELEIVSAGPMPAYTPPDPSKQTTTASGLKYEVLKEGSGPKPTAGQLVSVNYTGWLTDGTLVDSSVFRGQPYSYVLPGKVIAGWIEGIPLMSEGAVYRFEIPSNLGYGPQGRAPKVPPNSTLVFEIELVKIRT